MSRDEEDENKVVFKSKLSRNVYRVLFENQTPIKNDLFAPHRMTYIVDLTDDETDVPITSIRSKADCQNSEVEAFFIVNFTVFFR